MEGGPPQHPSEPGPPQGGPLSQPEYPPAPQAGYPPQAGHPPPPPFQGLGAPPKKSPVVPLAIGALVVVAVAVGLFLFLGRDKGGGGASGSAGTPEAAVRTFIEAALKGDCETVFGLLSQKTLAAFEQAEAAASLGGQSFNFREFICTALQQEGAAAQGKVESVTLKSQSGDTAVVTVTGIDSGGDRESSDVKCVREGGLWKIDLSEEFGAG